MRVKPDRKTAGVTVNGTFALGAAVPGKLAEAGRTDPAAPNRTVVHYQSSDFVCFTATGVTVKMLPGHLSAESSRPPYRSVRDVVHRLIKELPDVWAGGIRFHRTMDIPVARSADWDRMAHVLVAEFGGFPVGGGRISAMELDRWKPSGGSLAVTAGPSKRLLDDGRTGIWIDVRDSYYGGDPDGSTERVLEVLAEQGAQSVVDADSIIDGLLRLSESPRRRSMAA